MRSDRLDDSRQPVGRMPKSPHFHYVSAAARNDENTETKEHPMEGQVASLADEIQKGYRYGKIGACNQHVRNQVQRDESPIPEVAVPMRHEVSRRNHVFQELHGFLQEPESLSPLSTLRSAHLFLSGG